MHMNTGATEECISYQLCATGNWILREERTQITVNPVNSVVSKTWSQQ